MVGVDLSQPVILPRERDRDGHVLLIAVASVPERLPHTSIPTMSRIPLIATAAFGLEAVVSRELMELGYTDQTVMDGRV